MGQFAREQRSQRFIAEFNAELIAGIQKTFGIQEGTVLKIKKIFAGLDEWAGEDVVGYLLLETLDGHELEVELPTGSFFDPEYSEMEDQADALEPVFNLPAETIMSRFKKANLL